jgi:hypothetical protein
MIYVENNVVSCWKQRRCYAENNVAVIIFFIFGPLGPL